MPSLVGLRYRVPQGAKKFDFFCFFFGVFLLVTINALEYGNELGIV